MKQVAGSSIYEIMDCRGFRKAEFTNMYQLAKNIDIHQSGNSKI